MNTPNLTPDRHAKPIMRVLAALRRELDMPQQLIAEAIGCTRSAVSNWETGASEPRLMDVEDYARVVGYRLVVEPCDRVAAPAESDVQPSVVSTEGSGHPQPAPERLLDLARRMTQRADDGDNPSDCWAMADFADELRLMAGGTAEEPDRRPPILSNDTPEGDTANDH